MVSDAGRAAPDGELPGEVQVERAQLIGTGGGGQVVGGDAGGDAGGEGVDWVGAPLHVLGQLPAIGGRQVGVAWGWPQGKRAAAGRRGRVEQVARIRDLVM